MEFYRAPIFGHICVSRYTNKSEGLTRPGARSEPVHVLGSPGPLSRYHIRSAALTSGLLLSQAALHESRASIERPSASESVDWLPFEHEASGSSKC